MNLAVSWLYCCTFKISISVCEDDDEENEEEKVDDDDDHCEE